MPRLVKPSKRYKESFLEALSESINEPLPPLLNQLRLKYNFTPDQYLPWLDQNFHHLIYITQHPPVILKKFPYLPPQYHYWFIHDQTYIGRVIIRPHLTDALKRQGGHLGVWIRPKYRRQGYGSQLMDQALIHAQNLGLKKILFTCQSNNLASKKLIQKSGAKRAKPSRWSTPNRDRYWLTFPAH